MGDDIKEYDIIKLEKRSKVSKALGITASVFAGLASLGAITSAVMHGINHEVTEGIFYSVIAGAWAGICTGDIIMTKNKCKRDKQQIMLLKNRELTMALERKK